MYTITKTTFEMMKNDGTFGTLVKPKIGNYVTWQRDTLYDPVQEFIDIFKVHPLFFQNRQPVYGHENVTYSVLDTLDKHTVWGSLSVPNAEDDECEYCTLLPVERQQFPKHLIYTDGKLTCPVLLAAVKSEHINAAEMNSSEKVGKKGASMKKVPE